MSFRGTSWPWLILLSSWFWMDDFNGPWYLIRINNLKSFSRMFRRFGAAVAGPCQFLLSFFLSFFLSFRLSVARLIRNRLCHVPLYLYLKNIFLFSFVGLLLSRLRRTHLSHWRFGLLLRGTHHLCSWKIAIIKDPPLVMRTIRPRFPSLSTCVVFFGLFYSFVRSLRCVLSKKKKKSQILKDKKKKKMSLLNRLCWLGF